MSRRYVATEELVKEYIALFVNRRAYTIQSTRPDPGSGRHYYYRPKEKVSGAPIRLTRLGHQNPFPWDGSSSDVRSPDWDGWIGPCTPCD